MVRQRAAVENCRQKPAYAGSNPAPSSNLSCCCVRFGDVEVMCRW